MRRNKYSSIVLLTIGALGIFLFIDRCELPDNTFLLQALNNAGHTPLFGALSLLILALLRQILGARRMKTTTYYWLALMVSGLIAVFSELIQYVGPRDADLVDLFRDLAGAGSFLAVYWSYSSLSGSEGRGATSRGRRWWRVAGILVFLGAMAPLALWGGAYIYRDAKFPMVADFESSWSNKFLSSFGADLDYVPHPASAMDDAKNRVARLHIHPSDYAGLAVVEPYPDWTDHTSLNFEIYSLQPDSFNLEIRINDAAHNQDYYDRYNQTLTVAPGSNRFEILLDDVRRAPRSREMEMTEVVEISIFAWRPTETLTFCIDNIHLR